MMDSNKQVMTLANSIIGVSVLAMPFCFKECGMLLSLLLLVSSSILSRLTCYFLLKSAVLTRRRNYEFLAFHVYGPTGKLAVELGIIGFLLGTCVAFFVVMGDLSPQIISSMMGVRRPEALRSTIMFVEALLIVLPLGLLRNVASLEFICTASIGFYLCLVLKVIAESTPHLIGSDWMHELRLWRPEGVLQCLPIFSMALFCQTQLFEVFGNLPNTPLDKMIEAVRTSINLCTVLYASVGFFGYVAFNSDKLTGNVLMSLEPTLSSEIIKIGFVLSVALSFPLVIFPCRASLYSLFYRTTQPMPHDFAGSHIPDRQFKLLTVSIVVVSLIIGVLLPNIETVLGLVGSTIGVTVCITLPAMLMHVIARQEGDRLISKMTLAVGIIIMVLGTFSHLSSIDKATTLPEKKLLHDDLAHLKSFDQLSAQVVPSPALPQAAKNVALKSGLPEERGAKKDENNNKSKEKPKEDSSKTLKKLEILKEAIQENKQEQKKLLKEQQQILEGLKQHRREAEKLREKSELERRKSLAQNASVEYKLKTSLLKDAAVDKRNMLKEPVKKAVPSPEVDLKAVVPVETVQKAAAAPETPLIAVPPETPKKQAVVPVAVPAEKVPIVPLGTPKKTVIPPDTQRKQAAANEAPKDRPRPAVRAEVKDLEELKETVKSVGSKQEAPQSSQVRLQPPLPVPPQPSIKSSAAPANRNSGAVNSEPDKILPEPIPFVYQKKSSLVDQVQRREKREDRVKCDNNDSSVNKKPSSSLLPDVEPLAVKIDHIQPQIKNSVL